MYPELTVETLTDTDLISQLQSQCLSPTEEQAAIKSAIARKARDNTDNAEVVEYSDQLLAILEYEQEEISATSRATHSDGKQNDPDESTSTIPYADTEEDFMDTLGGDDLPDGIQNSPCLITDRTGTDDVISIGSETETSSETSPSKYRLQSGGPLDQQQPALNLALLLPKVDTLPESGPKLSRKVKQAQVRASETATNSSGSPSLRALLNQSPPNPPYILLPTTVQLRTPQQSCEAETVRWINTSDVNPRPGIEPCEQPIVIQPDPPNTSATLSTPQTSSTNEASLIQDLALLTNENLTSGPAFTFDCQTPDDASSNQTFRESPENDFGFKILNVCSLSADDLNTTIDLT